MYQQARDQTFFGIVKTQADGTVVGANDAFLSMLGWTRDEFEREGMTWRDITPPEHADVSRAGLVETECFRKDGTRIPIMMGSVTGRDDDSETFILDLRFHRRTESELSLAEQKLQLTVNTAPIVLFQVDRSGKVAHCDGRALERIGILAKDLVDRPITDVFSNKPEIVEVIEQGFQGNPISKLINISGRCFETRCLPVADGGNVKAVNCVAVDVTERMQAEQELLKSHAAFENALDGIARISPDGRYQSVNASYATLKGFQSAASLVGQDWISLIHPDDREKASIARHEMMKNGRAEFEIRGLKSDGSFLVKQAQLVQIKSTDNQYEGYYCFAKDITEQRRVQRHLIQTDRLAAVGTMAAGVAHEINNPLSCVITNLALIAEDLKAASVGTKALELQGLVKEAMIGADRVRGIVHGLKALTRDDDEVVDSVDLHAVLESALSMAANEIRHRAMLIRWFGKVPLVRANEGKLTQVILNLLLNASHAIPEGRVDENIIRVMTRTEPSGEALIEIEDSGVGMTSDLMKRIFDPFFTTKPVGEGTGLGLSICHGILASFNGGISVRSEPGVGTVFSVRLQSGAAMEDRTSAVAQSRAAAPALRARVLVIDDEVQLTQALLRVLSKEHEVEVASGGKQGISKILEGESRDYDVVLCDLMMPDLTGMDIYDQVKAQRPGFEKRFIFMTGGAFTAKSCDFIETVANPKLEKPFELQLVRSLVRSHASQFKTEKESQR